MNDATCGEEDKLWANGPVRPLDTVLLWLGAAALTVLVTRRLLTAPAMLTVAAAAASVVVLVGSFLAAPVRRPAGSLARANLHQLAGGRSCGLADGIQVLTDGAVLVPADTSEYLAGRTAYLAGFTSLGGFDPGGSYRPATPPRYSSIHRLFGSCLMAACNAAYPRLRFALAETVRSVSP